MYLFQQVPMATILNFIITIHISIICFFLFINILGFPMFRKMYSSAKLNSVVCLFHTFVYNKAICFSYYMCVSAAPWSRENLMIKKTTNKSRRCSLSLYTNILIKVLSCQKCIALKKYTYDKATKMLSNLISK